MPTSPETDFNHHSVETYQGSVYPWQCDSFGHMNTQFYMMCFDQAELGLFAHMGLSAATLEPDNLGWADVHHAITYREEVQVGSHVVCRSTVIRTGRTSLHSLHKLFRLERGTEVLSAELEAATVMFDLGARKAHPLPENIDEIIAALSDR